MPDLTTRRTSPHFRQPQDLFFLVDHLKTDFVLEPLDLIVFPLPSRDSPRPHVSALHPELAVRSQLIVQLSSKRNVQQMRKTSSAFTSPLQRDLLILSLFYLSMTLHRNLRIRTTCPCVSSSMKRFFKFGMKYIFSLRTTSSSKSTDLLSMFATITKSDVRSFNEFFNRY